MIGNKYLYSLYKYPDEDTSLNQLLEMLNTKEKDFIDSLYNEVNLEKCDEDELIYLTKAAALIDYYLQIFGREVPSWLRNEKLSFETPYYHSKRLTDFEKVRLLYTSTAPFRARNVYFDLESIKRI